MEIFLLCNLNTFSVQRYLLNFNKSDIKIFKLLKNFSDHLILLKYFGTMNSLIEKSFSGVDVDDLMLGGITNNTFILQPPVCD